MIVGYLTLTAETTVRETFETASWYRDHKVPPGRYPVHVDDARVWSGEGFYDGWVRYEGICTASYFVSRLLDASAAHVDEDKGKTMGVSQHVALCDPRIELIPELLVEAWRVEHPAHPELSLPASTSIAYRWAKKAAVA